VVADSSVSDADLDAFIARFQEEFAAHADEAEAAPEPETVDAGGRRIRYLALGEGDGVPIVFIHGFGGDLNNWQFNQEALAAGRATYALDLPGHGGSTKDLGAGPVDVTALADAVLDFMDAKGIAKAHLVGHSLGGAIALHLALSHGDRVGSVTAICSAGLGPEINMAYVDGFMAAKRRKQLQPVLEMLVADPAMVSREMIEDVLKFKRLDGVETALNRIIENTFAGGRQALQLTGRLGELTVPVQVIWGRQDRIIPVRHSQGLPSRIHVHVHDDAGHMVHMEKAAEVNQLIEALGGGG
jgi:pyruvate dehydrogenase E2 component (dihydrolipoamide acetyltransferase)